MLQSQQLLYHNAEQYYNAIHVLIPYVGNDGVIRVYDSDKGELARQLSGGHTKSVVGLFGYVCLCSVCCMVKLFAHN